MSDDKGAEEGAPIRRTGQGAPTAPTSKMYGKDGGENPQVRAAYDRKQGS